MAFKVRFTITRPNGDTPWVHINESGPDHGPQDALAAQHGVTIERNWPSLDDSTALSASTTFTAPDVNTWNAFYADILPIWQSNDFGARTAAAGIQSTTEVIENT